MTVNRGAIGARVRELGRNLVYGDDFGGVQSLVWASQWWSSAQLEEFQWERIRGLVQHAKGHSQFFRDRLARIDPGALSPFTFAEIPPLTRGDIVAAGMAIGTAAIGPRTLRRHSGGSSGLRVAIPLDRATYAWYFSGLWRGLRWWGTDLMERGVLLVGPGAAGWRAVATKAKDWVMSWLRIPVRDDFTVAAVNALQKIRDYEPDFIYGYPSAVDTLTRTMQAAKIALRKPPKVIALTGEPLYGFQRMRISDRWESPLAEEYGCGEVGTMGFECPDGTLHIAEENAFIEASDTKLLVTHLHNLRFPLIRYDTGDLGRIDARICRCGRPLRALAITGRARDRLLGPNGVTPARHVLEPFFSALPESVQGRVQIIHRRTGSVVLQVEGGAAKDGHLAEIARIGLDVLGAGWHVSVVEVPFLQRLPSGKLPYFVRRA